MTFHLVLVAHAATLGPCVDAKSPEEVPGRGKVDAGACLDAAVPGRDAEVPDCWRRDCVIWSGGAESGRDFLYQRGGRGLFSGTRSGLMSDADCESDRRG